MKKQILLPFATALAGAVLLPHPALAEVSALDVWNSWKSYIEKNGQTITTGSEQVTGDAIILRDVKIKMEGPDGNMSGTLGLLEFRERPDGTVAITMSPDLPIALSVAPPGEDAVDLALIVRQTGLSMIASGDPGNITFDYLASQVGIALDKLFVEGEAVPVVFETLASDITGSYRLSVMSGLDYAARMNAAQLSYRLEIEDMEGGGKMRLAGDIADIASDSRVSFPEGLDMNEPSAVFSAGVAIEAEVSTGQTRLALDVVNGPDSLKLNGSTEGNSLTFTLIDGSMRYGVAASGASYTVQAPRIPFPELTVGLGEIAAEFMMPMAKSDAPRDFGAVFRLRDLEISDMIWQMFDPGGIMPRDPLTLVVDLSGKMRWLVDLADPATMAAAEGDGQPQPGELYSLSVNELKLSALGADISGEGAFTFDNSDLTTFDGMPAPTGKLEVQLVGLNGVLDRLIQMGLLPDDQAMGMRMMLGLFARPAGGEDTMISTIEVRGDGSVIANGQQLK